MSTAFQARSRPWTRHGTDSTAVDVHRRGKIGSIGKAPEDLRLKFWRGVFRPPLPLPLLQFSKLFRIVLRKDDAHLLSWFHNLQNSNGYNPIAHQLTLIVC